MKHIQSAQNPQVKQWKKLAMKKERERTGLFMAEGFHLVEEALKSPGVVTEMIVADGTDIPPHLHNRGIPVTTVAKDIFTGMSETETPQGIMAVCRQMKDEQTLASAETFLLLDAVQDPGNLGTMIRTADAAGIDAVIAGTGSVDIYNPKVLRSAQGSHFHLPVISGNLEEWIPRLIEKEIPVYGTALEGAKDYRDAVPASKFALLVGNEGSGVAKELLAKTSVNLYVPIYGKSESLNVAVAAGVLLYYLRSTHE
ncbi:RNA methyltransferase [Neobacillus notoginsengisoli]|uniref:RNA methyltransferase n=1 Tax=Neobacillus notoginsengisoli TaxID=1578198 RepID=A0A417YU45_9BACI|nr:RNA methyltransferase [Neobacillus notoginsengisoli]RHW40696.1 RNA methyltransferase [Neobacillus notoginsengisoli]